MSRNEVGSSLSVKRVVLFWTLAVVGLAPAWQVAEAVTYAAQDFDPDADALDADCDDCDLTTLLEGLPYLVGILAAYLVLVVLAFVLLKRTGWFTR